VDWGQDLRGLARWLRENRPESRVGLAYFGNVDPSILAASGEGIDFRLAPPARLDDLRPLTIQQNSRLRDSISRWLDENATRVTEWSQRNPGTDMWANEEFRQLVAGELEIPEGPQPGLFAISVNLLHGLPFRIRDHQGGLWDFNAPLQGHTRDPFAYFRRLQPIGSIGQSILLYEITRDQAAALRRDLGLPALE
jgi:hypothetical protein